MNKFFLSSLLMLLGSTSVFADSTYVVRSGDTILKIADREIGILNDTKDARRYTLAREILEKNPGINANLLKPGQKIILPNSSKKIRKLPPINFEKSDSPREVIAAPEPQVPAPQIITDSKPPAPIVAPDAPAEQIVQQITEKEHADFFIVQPRAQYDDIHFKDRITDQEYHLNSQVYGGLNLGYGKSVGTSSHLLFEAGTSFAQMKDLHDSNVDFENKALWLKNFGVGFETEFTPTLSFHLLALYSDYLVVAHNAASTGYKVKSVMMPAAEVSFSWDFWSLQSSALGLTLAGEYVGEGKIDDIKYKSGFEPAATLYWKSDKGNHNTNYRVDLRYNMSAQKSDFIEQHGTGLGLRVGFIFPL